jgi:hypothetical protein
MIVRFSLPNGIDARGVAAELAHALAGVLAEPSHGDRERASFSYLWLPEDSPEAITVERVAPAGAVKTAYRDEDPRSVWVLHTSRHRDVSEFTERLNALGAGDIRCFTEEEWAKR